MGHAIAIQAIAVSAFVVCFGLFYLTGLLLQDLKKTEASRGGELVLLLLSLGCFGFVLFLTNLFAVTPGGLIPG